MTTAKKKITYVVELSTHELNCLQYLLNRHFDPYAACEASGAYAEKDKKERDEALLSIKTAIGKVAT